MDASPIGSALILAGTRIFRRPGESSPASPLATVGGLSLFQRTILTLQRGGLSRFVVLAGDETEILKRQLRGCGRGTPGGALSRSNGDDRIRSEMRWLPIREFPPGDPRTWETIANIFSGPYLVAGTGAIFPVSLVARVREEGGKGEPVVVVRNTEAPPSVLRQAQHERLREGDGGGVVTVEEAATLALDVDLVVLPSTFTSPEGAGAQEGEYPLQAAIERGIRRGQVRVLPLDEDWYQDVCAEGAASLAQAEWTLLRSLKGGLCSKWITRALLQTPLTPRGVTMLAAVVGVLSGAAFAWGGYTAGVAGALLFQLSVLLHRCDQAVARLTFIEAPVGARRAIALGTVVRVSLYAGLGWVAYHVLAAVGSNIVWPLLAWQLRSST